MSDHDDRSASRSEVSAVQEYDEVGRGREGKRGKKGKTRGGEDEDTRIEADADDDLLQEYQQQLSQELGGASGPSFKTRAEGVLNNELGKKKKKKKQLKSTEGEIR